MAKYVKVKKVLKMLHSLGVCGAERESWADGWDKAIDTAISELESIPAADVHKVKHGEWFGTVCTACGESTSFYFDCKYCPNCGAKMDAQDGETNE
ncbi:MAG: hypothetical protein NC203_00465 [Firmicutes bacterium]|nr:hypothetical protein [[Eubacterium] siraeum]MCM1486812.1 hypothetical protein [Bacillota bacterium]